jgi:hypothetical protein
MIEIARLSWRLQDKYLSLQPINIILSQNNQHCSKENERNDE